MKLVDLHCDTVYECLVNNKSLLENNLMVDIKRGTKYEEWVQTFAFWISDDLRGQTAFDNFTAQNAVLERDIALSGGKIKRYTGEEELKPGVCYAVKAVEGGAALAGELSNVGRLYESGVRFLTLCWNGENELASGALAKGGFKDFGRCAVKRMEEIGLVADVSHLNEESFWDLCSFAKKPFIATHSNSYEVNPHPRNLKDDQIKEIINCGGIIGLNFYKGFISEKEDPSLSDMLAHVDRFLKLGAEDCLALGSDFDGADMPDFLEDITALANFYENMLHYYGKTLTEKITHQNAKRFLKTVM